MENLHDWSNRIFGAKQFLCIMQDWKILLETGKDAKIYSDAVYECLKDSYNMGKFLEGGQISYYDHERNTKGKLIKVKARII